jgi:hypothetical protein
MAFYGNSGHTRGGRGGHMTENVGGIWMAKTVPITLHDFWELHPHARGWERDNKRGDQMNNKYRFQLEFMMLAWTISKLINALSARVCMQVQGCEGSLRTLTTQDGRVGWACDCECQDRTNGVKRFQLERLT